MVGAVIGVAPRKAVPPGTSPQSPEAVRPRTAEATPTPTDHQSVPENERASSWPLALRKRWQLRLTGANGQPAVAGYLWDEQTTAFRAESIVVLTFQAARIEEITAFRSPELFPRFALPEHLPNDTAATTALAPTQASHHVSLGSPRSIEVETP